MNAQPVCLVSRVNIIQQRATRVLFNVSISRLTDSNSNTPPSFSPSPHNPLKCTRSYIYDEKNHCNKETRYVYSLVVAVPGWLSKVDTVGIIIAVLLERKNILPSSSLLSCGCDCYFAWDEMLVVLLYSMVTLVVATQWWRWNIYSIRVLYKKPTGQVGFLPFSVWMLEI